MPRAGTRTSGGVGRPRLLDPDTEVQVLLDAAFAAMRRNGFADATVDDVLAEAGLSTRAFYRHFESKDALLCTLFRRDAEIAAQRLRTRVEAAASPREQLEVWIDEVLSFTFQPRRAERLRVLGSKAARLAVGYERERADAVELLTEPLVALLDEGRRDDSFPATDPEVDAWMIYAIVFGMMDRPPGQRLARTRREAVAQVLRFCLPALGAKPSSTGTASGHKRRKA